MSHKVDKYIEAVFAALQEKFALRSGDFQIFVTEGEQKIKGLPVAVYEVFSGDDELVCSWEKILLDGREVHVWEEDGEELSVEQLVRKILRCGKNSFFFSLKTNEERIKELERKNKKSWRDSRNNFMS
ncbi:hypothetical protein MEL_308 [Melbournevirus]|uniref:hypothetical protein n=1 Tax=Melbournevirus TaxID=1560514 RepID=UPI00051F5598|nr:hypothetical protein MEL_308 [Melbournevirus]AIT54921.1 hypothetical protein MEL_308 [Melbournevirus]